MIIPTEEQVSNADLRMLLEGAAIIILRNDGDRDYMNTSNLTVQQTTAIATYLKMAAERLK